MCPPDHFRVEYEINPWMHIDRAVDPRRAKAQWQSLYETYIELGLRVDLAEPREGLPDMVFCANAALVHGGTAVLSRFHHPQRRPEEARWRELLSDLGQQVVELPPGMDFEGAGDALLVGQRLFAGHGFRTDRASHPELGRLLDLEVVSLELVDPRFYHLDTCFCPLAAEVVMFAPAAFSPESADLIRNLVPQVIEVPTTAAANFICNGVVVAQRLVSSSGVERLSEALEHQGLGVTALPMGEFMKAGGGVRCLTLELN